VPSLGYFSVPAQNINATNARHHNLGGKQNDKTSIYGTCLWKQASQFSQLLFERKQLFFVGLSWSCQIWTTTELTLSDQLKGDYYSDQMIRKMKMWFLLLTAG
jgi:hypothetical protein